MGNRAVIAFESQPTIGIYLHWNGGPESVLAFLEETKRRGARSPGSDETYAFARLVQVITEYVSNKPGPHWGLSVGVGPIDDLDCDNLDNGLYWIGDNWQITKRAHTNSDSPVCSVDDLGAFYTEQYASMLKAMEVARNVA